MQPLFRFMLAGALALAACEHHASVSAKPLSAKPVAALTTPAPFAKPTTAFDISFGAAGKPMGAVPPASTSTTTSTTTSRAGAGPAALRRAQRAEDRAEAIEESADDRANAIEESMDAR